MRAAVHNYRSFNRSTDFIQLSDGIHWQFIDPRSQLKQGLRNAKEFVMSPSKLIAIALAVGDSSTLYAAVDQVSVKPGR
jgi:hypothetical protein